MLADPSLHNADRRVRVRVGRHVDLDGQVDVVDVDEALAQRARHRPIELDDNGLRGPDGGVHGLDAGPERAEPVSVGRRRVDEHRIERHGPALEQSRHVRQEDGHVVGPSLVHGGTGVRADEQRPMSEMAVHGRREVGSRALGMQMHDGHIAQVGRSGDQAVEQDRRGRRRAMEVQPLSGADARSCVLRRNQSHPQSLPVPRMGAPAVRTPATPRIVSASCRA